MKGWRASRVACAGPWTDRIRGTVPAGGEAMLCFLGGVPVLESFGTGGDLLGVSSGTAAGVVPGMPGEARVHCGHCGREPLRADGGEADGCLGWLPGVANACCGHGTGLPNVQFSDGRVLYGEEALAAFRELGAAGPPPAVPRPRGGRRHPRGGLLVPEGYLLRDAAADAWLAERLDAPAAMAGACRALAACPEWAEDAEALEEAAREAEAGGTGGLYRALGRALDFVPEAGSSWAGLGGGVRVSVAAGEHPAHPWAEELGRSTAT